MRLALCTLLIIALLLLLVLPAAARASDTTEEQLARITGGPGMVAIMVGAAALPLLEEDEDAKCQTLRTADGITSAWLLTEGLALLIGSQRPDGTTRDSYPSGHATAAFAAATMVSEDRPDQAPYWYGAAAAISWSQVRMKRHRESDAWAGALIGFGIAKLELSLPQGILLAPFVDSDGCSGIEALWQF